MVPFHSAFFFDLQPRATDVIAVGVQEKWMKNMHRIAGAKKNDLGYVPEAITLFKVLMNFLKL